MVIGPCVERFDRAWTDISSQALAHTTPCCRLKRGQSGESGVTATMAKAESRVPPMWKGSLSVQSRVCIRE